MNKTLAFVTAVIAATALNARAAAESAPPVAQPAKPNVLVIMADDLGYGDVHCFDPQHGKIPTPNLDKLAAQGMVFTDAHSGSAVCTPTRYGLLTGRYAWRSWLKNWVLFDHMPLLIDPQTPTIQRTLKENGYTTGIIGKWHLGWGADINADWNHEVKPGPLETGFDYSYALCWGVNVPGKPAWPAFVENRRMVGLRDGDDVNNPDTQKRIVNDLHDTGIHLATKATDYIRQNKKVPFFLYLPTFNVHLPYAPNARFKSKLGVYADYVRELDWIVSQVTDTLEKEGIADNTLIIFTSDNGSACKDTPRGHRTNGPWRGMKAQIYEGGHRVPFIVKWSGKVAPGSTSAATICLTDIYATVTGALGIAKPQGSAPDSFDFSPLFDPARTAEFRRPPVIHHSVTGLFAIRSGDWKLIDGLGDGYRMNFPKAKASAVGKPVKDPVTGKFQDLTYFVPPFPQPKPGEPDGQLFNLKDDPGEITNLYAKHPEIVTRLSAELKAIQEATPEAFKPSDDSGPYTELLGNRDFLDQGANSAHWAVTKQTGADGAIRVISTQPLTDKLPNSLEVEIKAADPDHLFGVVNDGNKGVPVKPNTTYRVAFHVKGALASPEGTLTVNLENTEGTTVFAAARTPVITQEWQKVEITLTTGAYGISAKPTTNGRFIISAGSAGKFWLSLVSLSVPNGNGQLSGKAAKTGLPDAQPVLEIDLQAPATPVSPILYGLMTEEINHAYDGGVYAELIQNRAFLDHATDPVHWSVGKQPGADGTIGIITSQPLTDKLPNSLEVHVKAATAEHPLRVVNDGYWGIPIKPNTTYRASFYVNGDAKLGKLGVSLESADSSTVFASAQTPAIPRDWQKIELTLTTGATVKPTTDGRFVISAGNPGTFQLSLVSLFPPTYKDRPNGLRVDLMEKMAAMKPKFHRFPGGAYLQGRTIDERFDWKASIGPLEQRPGHMGCRAYRSTGGMGLLEFMAWCEDLGMEPILGVYSGWSYAMKPVKAGPLLEPYVQEALEEIEFLTGDAKTSYWAGLRAKYGHPEPFKLTYVEIGNEDFFPPAINSYDTRYTQFHDAIKAKYPLLQVIASARSATTRKTDLYDDHFYFNSGRFFQTLNHYDKMDRKGPKVFVGEWATISGDCVDLKVAPTPNFQESLSDAAWMTSMERNSDLIVMQCYAPLFTNVNPGARQWRTNLIGYNNLESYGSPSYYAHVMFANHLGNVTPKSALKAADKVFLPYSVTRQTDTGKLFLKVVNPGATDQTVTIDLKGAAKVSGEGQAITLRASGPNDTNSITEPTKIIPVTEPLKNVASGFDYTFPAWSVTVLELTAQ